MLLARHVNNRIEREDGVEAGRRLVECVQRCLDAGDFHRTPAERIALHLWSVSHGMVSLELAGHLDVADPETAYVEALVYAGLPFVASA